MPSTAGTVEVKPMDFEADEGAQAIILGRIRGALKREPFLTLFWLS